MKLKELFQLQFENRNIYLKQTNITFNYIIKVIR